MWNHFFTVPTQFFLTTLQYLQASASGNLQLHSKLKHSALIFPELHSKSLLSICQVCDDRCIALFDDKMLKIYRNDKVIKEFLSTVKSDNLVLEGNRNSRDGLYDVPFPKLHLNYIVQKDKNKLELAQYLHGCAYSPAISTFQTCVNKGNFITWPGIDDVKFKRILENISRSVS